MSRGQTPRTPANFPRMKHRAFGRQIASWGGGYICNEHGISWHWGKVLLPEYLDIQQDIDDHEARHILDDEDDGPWVQEELRLAAERNKEHHRRIGLID